MDLLTGASSRGELHFDEFNERLDAALGADFIDELAALTADLPAAIDAGPRGTPKAHYRRRRQFWHRAGFKYHAVPYLLVNGMLVGIWALTGHHFFWPFFPIAGWGIGLGMHALVAGSLPAQRCSSQGASRDALPEPLGPQSPLPDSEVFTPHVAVLFADMVDSTGFNERLGDVLWNALRTRYLTMMRDCVMSHRGTEVNTYGDGLFARFDLPVDAVAAAIAIQERIDAEQEATPTNPLLRVGIHAGRVIEDGDDLIGNMVNLAARLTADADPGQILVTESVADLVGESFVFDDCGLRELRGLTRPRHVLALRR